LTPGIERSPLALAAGEPGMETLYPIANVVIGRREICALGVLARPTLCCTASNSAAEKFVEAGQQYLELELVEGETVAVTETWPAIFPVITEIVIQGEK